MYIDNMTFVLFFPKMEKVRARALELESALEEYFEAPFTILPIPEDAPPEIPRIIAKSHNGHSQLTVSLINLQLEMNFDDSYNEEISTCFDYLKTRVEVLKGVMSKFCDQSFLFSGISARVILNKDVEDTMSFLKNKFVGIESTIEPYNVTNKVAYVLEDAYYLNLTIANVRTYEGKVGEGITKPEIREISNHVAVEVDVNDKFGYNHNKEHRCTNDSISFINNTVEQFIKHELCKVLLKGEIMYDKQ
ncbi:MAG: hypothetical protein E6590_00755 [Clostridiales bacterium]|uniref:hypothetical protein n=1 Tax=Zhenhengia sp. TaxID=2944208 RepID=UPI00290D0E45|nr:hypothetical protein [Clostridiales bacterium]